MIPKRIIYGWFGKAEKDPVSKRCIESWKKNCPDYEIVELNEETFDIHSSLYTEDAYAQKRWAFVTDYAKLWYLSEVGGGFILDTDCYLLQGLDSIRELPGVIGYQNWGELGTSLIGLPDNSSFARRMIGYYAKQDFKSSVTVNQMLTKMMKDCYSYGIPCRTHHNLIDNSTKERICVFDKSVFACRGPQLQLLLQPDSVAIHLFTWSWMGCATEVSRSVRERNREMNVAFIDNFLSRVTVLPLHIDDREIPTDEREFDQALLEEVRVSTLPGAVADSWKTSFKKKEKANVKKESKSKLEEFSDDDLLKTSVRTKKRLF